MNKQPSYRFVIAYPDTNDGPYKAAFGTFNCSDSIARFVGFWPHTLPGKMLLRLSYSERWRFPLKRQLIDRFNKKISRVIINALHQIPGEGDMCLIINQYMYSPVKNGILEMLRTECPELKTIYYFSDLVQLDKRRMKICSNREQFQADAIITYDQNDAARYKLHHFPLPFSLSKVEGENAAEDYDVCFIGRAKERYPDILSVYDELTAKGIKCHFTVVTEGMKLTERRTGIHYQKHMIPYRKYLQIENNSRCILEIVQEGSCGYTTRIPEAVFLSKRIISNNLKLKEDRFFDPSNMLIFEKTEQITASFIKNDQEIYYSREFQEIFKPESFLSFITEILDEKSPSKKSIDGKR